MIQTPQISAHFVTIYHAAQASGLSQSAVKNAIRSGQLVASHTLERRVVIARGSLDRWLESLFYKSGGTDDPSKISPGRSRLIGPLQARQPQPGDKA